MEDRTAVRVVLLDADHQVAVVHVHKYGYYKVPGGGVEPNEDLETAAKRETLEESGCHCEIIAELGRTETDIPEWGMHDVSYGFLARVVGDKGSTNFEDYEQERKFAIEWLPSLHDAITQIEANTEISDPNAALLQARDLSYLKAAASLLHT